MNKKRVFSGTRATGKLHLGNYLGAVKGYIKLSENPKYETIYMVMDLHAITTPFDKEELSDNTRGIIMDYLACGLDPKKSIITAQSLVPEHAYLMHLLSSEISVARMQHLPTFKEKVKQHPGVVTMALLNYPVLMAADILLYKAGLVPIGVDQEPHLEIAREIARKMNDKYGLDFPEPVSFKTSGAYVPSLTGEGKMSKSVEGSYINLSDDLKTIKKKIAKVPTDSGQGNINNITVGGVNKREYISDETKKEAKGVEVLMELVDLILDGCERNEYEGLYQGPGLKYSEIKTRLATAIYYRELKPIQERRKKLEADPNYVNEVIREGAERARTIAKQTIIEVRKAMGLIQNG